MLIFEIEEKEWEIVFLKIEPSISLEDRLKLCYNSASMYMKKEEKRNVKGEKFEGVLRTDGKYHNLGIYGGREYIAQIETNSGKKELSFLVAERINETLN